MKQARRWLLLAAAVAILPQAAYAQKKKLPKSAQPSSTSAVTAPADSTPVPAAPADADAPATPPSGDAAGGGAGLSVSGQGSSVTDITGGAAGGVDICQTVPDAPQCTAAKQINLSDEAKKTVHAEIYAVQQQYVIKAGRFEIQPYFEVTLNDQFVSHNAPGLALNYYITQVLAVGVNGNWYGGLNADSDFNFQNRRAGHISVPLNEYQFSGDANFTYVPMYGKFAGFGDFIFHYDAYIDGGIGVIQTRPIPVIDPDNRKFNWNTLVNFDVGIGLRIFFNRWIAAVLEVRDLMYMEKIENINVATGAADPTNLSAKNNPLNPSTWYDSQTHFTNDVQMQVGLSLFLPTSFEYRLPK